MLKTGLEFAPGTTEDCKRLVMRLYPPDVLLGAYRTAREMCQTSDIVLVASDQSPDISGGSRSEYRKHLKQIFGERAPVFRMWSESAQNVLQLPSEADAMWLVVDVHGEQLPIMCALFAMPYSEGVN